MHAHTLYRKVTQRVSPASNTDIYFYSEWVLCGKILLYNTLTELTTK